MKISVVVGILINSYQKILIAKRPSHVSQPGLWELPGGKINSNESPYSALKRELNEEIGIEVISAEPFLKIDYDYSDYSVILEAWKILDFKGIPKGNENQIICWTDIAALSTFNFPKANQEIISKICQKK